MTTTSATSKVDPRARSAPVREILSLAWRDADLWIKIRIYIVLAMITGLSIMMALGPVALKWIIDGLLVAPRGEGATVGGTLLLLIALYVVIQWLARVV